MHNFWNKKFYPSHISMNPKIEKSKWWRINSNSKQSKLITSTNRFNKFNCKPKIHGDWSRENKRKLQPWVECFRRRSRNWPSWLSVKMMLYNLPVRPRSPSRGKYRNCRRRRASWGKILSFASRGCRTTASACTWIKLEKSKDTFSRDSTTSTLKWPRSTKNTTKFWPHINSNCQIWKHNSSTYKTRQNGRTKLLKSRNRNK